MRGSLAAVSIALAGGIGCMAGMAGQREQAPPRPMAQEAAGEASGTPPAPACPMSVPGTDVSAADTADGEMITFTTSPEWAPDLRARVREMADTHNRLNERGDKGRAMPGGMPHGEGMMGGGSMGSAGGGAGKTSMMTPPSHATAEDVANGARIVIAPNDPADLESLRSAIRMQAEHMRETGTCPSPSPHM